MGFNLTNEGSNHIADNWQHKGYTKGSAKSHRGLHNKHTREETPIKKIFVRRNDDAPFEYKLWAKGWLPPHQPSWQAKSLEEKARKKGREAKRKYLNGRLFFYHRGEVWRTTGDGAEPALASDCVAEAASAGPISSSQIAWARISQPCGAPRHGRSR